MWQPLLNHRHELQGRVVLVTSTRDQRHPPTARRGNLEVRERGRGGPLDVAVVLEFPDRFNEPAHQRIIPLDDTALARLLASEKNGTYELSIDEELD